MDTDARSAPTPQSPLERQRALELLSSGKRFVLSGHQRPDGDCLGAQAALAGLLAEQGREVWIYNPDLPEKRYAYLAEKVPQIHNLNSFPTTIFLGRDGLVRGVHAGFAGAASGVFHDSAKEEITATVERLLAENSTTRSQR